MPDKPTATERILADLTTIGTIAAEPMLTNPLLPIVLQQHQALSRIAKWTIDARAGLEQEAQPTEAPTVASVDVIPPMKNGRAATPA